MKLEAAPRFSLLAKLEEVRVCRPVRERESQVIIAPRLAIRLGGVQLPAPSLSLSPRLEALCA